MKKRLLSLLLTLACLGGLNLIPVEVSAASISIGDYVQMGTYYGQPILWRCVDIDENGPLMLSDRILCLKPFDAAGTNTSGSHGRGYYYNSTQGYYRQKSGSNYWADSNMRCWLNSTATAGNVTWTCGNAPTSSNVSYNTYDQEAGFLTNFTETERNAMKTVTQKSLLDGYEHSTGSSNTINSNYHQYSYNISSVVQNYSTAYYEQVTDTMFLLDVKQINTVYNNSSILGFDYYIGKPTAECIANSNYTTSSLSTSSNWYTWLRSPTASDDGDRVRYVRSDGHVDYYSAYSGYYGVRPAFYLNLTSNGFVSGDGTLSAPYSFEYSKSDAYILGFENIAGGVITNNAEGELSTVTDLCVGSEVGSIAVRPQVNDGATWALFRTQTATTPISSNTLNLNSGRTTTAYIKVTSEDGEHIRQYKISIYRQLSSNAPSISNDRKTVTITANDGYIIKYTTDGSDPTAENGTVYTGAFEAPFGTVIKAIANRSDKDEWSSIVTHSVDFEQTKCAKPVITQHRGKVTITVDDGSTIKYTTDGTTPSSSNGIVYNGSFVVEEGTTIKAYAYDQDKDLDSDVVEYTVVFKLNILLTMLDFYKTEANGFGYDFYLEKISDKTATVVIAFYSGGQLTGVELIPFEAEGVETEIYGEIYNSYDADTWRAFVVSNMTVLTPLSNAVGDLIE